MYPIGRQKLGEFARQELARVIAVEGAHDVYRLVTGVIIHDHEGVFAGAVDRLDEGAGNVHMYETPGVGRSVSVAGMRLSSSVSLQAGGARRWKRLRKTRGRIGYERRESLDASSARMQATVHAARGVVGRHDVYVGGSTPRVHGQSTGAGIWCFRFCDVPLVKSASTEEWKSAARAVYSGCEFHCAGSGETAVDSGGRPQLSDR
eukprot:6213335-Pleurochrysis_carterae.AAC.1